MATAPLERQRTDPLTEPLPAGLTRSGAARLDAIDMLRGLVIVIMVLDHVRDMFHAQAFAFDPTDPAKTTLAIYATRWVTHLCAATFVFLSGVSIWFQRANGKTAGALSAFLVKRGLWLILLEVTVVSFGFNFAEPFAFLQVIWAIGASMVCMAALTRLPARAVLVVGVGLIGLTPLALAATEGATGAAAVAKALLIGPPNFFAPALGSGPGAVHVPILAFYAVLPWLGAMGLGFGLAPIFRRPHEERWPRVLLLAVGFLAAFALLRGIDGYGDPAPWQRFATDEQTALSFMNVSKYPPSPDYVLATLGVSMLLFLALGQLRGFASRVLLTFGRTPLFTYICHIYVAHGLMLATAIAIGLPWTATSGLVAAGAPLPGWGFALPVVYLVWASVVAILYPLSRWYEGVRRRRRDWWLSYL